MVKQLFKRNILICKDIVSLDVAICNELLKLKTWFTLNKLSISITETKLHKVTQELLYNNEG